MNKSKRKSGFTLAEVLITLGIIGVVAAITIPILMTNYKRHVIETELKEFYSIMNQALKLSEYENEDMDGWEWSYASIGEGSPGYNKSDYEWFQKYLQPYLKSSTVKDAYHLYCVWYDGFAVEFINGTGMSCGVQEGGGEFYKQFVCMFYPKAGTIKIMQDESNNDKNSISGKDYFVFQINKEGPDKGFRPYNSNNCKPSTGMKFLPSAGCAKLIKDNNWKIPHNYPIKL